MKVGDLVKLTDWEDGIGKEKIGTIIEIAPFKVPIKEGDFQRVKVLLPRGIYYCSTSELELIK